MGWIIARSAGSGGGSAKRRSSIRWIALLATALVFAAACSGAATDPDEVGGEGAGGEVKNPGVFVHALDGEPITLDPARAALGEYGEQAIIQAYEFLVDVGPDAPEPIPGLATEVPTVENGLVSEDGLTYRFPIREGVEFHDGSDLTAEVVKYSWDRAIELALPEGQASTLSDTIEETRAVDDLTFEVTLQRPNAAFITSVVYSTPAAIVSMEAVEDNGGVTAGEPNEFMDGSMVGTGPHELISWERNEQLNFEVFEDYWGEPAALDARWQNVPEESAIVLGLRAGDYDAIQFQPTFADELENAEGITLDTSGLLLEPFQLAFNLNIPEGALPRGDTIPTDFFYDKRVRQAFNFAFDYDAFIEGILGGLGEPATYIPPGVLGYDPEAPVYEQDLEQAEQLLTDTGWWEEGFTVSVLVEDNPAFEPIGLILKDSIEGLNPKFRVNVLTVSESQFDEAHGASPFEYAMWIKNADPFIDPHYYLSTYQHPDGEWGERLGFANGYENPDQIAELIDSGFATTDVEEREAIYAELLPLLYDDPMWIYPAQEVNAQAYRSWVDGFVYNPLWKTLRWRYYDKG
ncbi:MAG TPA: ABC transporter substrate-binding protein [Actinomycetota bacterium]|nr:ABC transporter substrate-binding protein [Actinomycetota bacterium]